MERLFIRGSYINPKKEVSAKFTVYYEHEGTPKHMSCKCSKSTGEVAMMFHKRLQNNMEISHKDYFITAIERGEIANKNPNWGGGYRTNEEENEILRRTPDVRGQGKCATKFS